MEVNLTGRNKNGGTSFKYLGEKKKNKETDCIAKLGKKKKAIKFDK